MTFLGIDIGGTYIKYARVAASGQVNHVKKVVTPQNLSDFKSTILDIVKTSQDEIQGIGISCPGKIDSIRGIVYHGGALPFLHELALSSLVKDAVNLPCKIINDGKAAALAELWLGNLKGVSNGLAMTLGTGVGGGIICDGKILQGQHFQAGELSFVLRSPGLAEPDKMLGHSGSAVRFIHEASILLGLDFDDGPAVFSEIDKGENAALSALFATYCLEIAHLLINLQATLDMQRVVIGGGISAQASLISGIKKAYIAIRQNFDIWDLSWKPLEIMTCHFQNDANLIGAVYQLLPTRDSIEMTL